jgi:hypothetical protein
MPEQPGEGRNKGIVTLQYVAHIAAMTGKVRESVELGEGKTIYDLIGVLDQKYPGVKETFDPIGGVFNSRTAILVRRPGQSTKGIIKKDEEIKDGDILTLW